MAVAKIAITIDSRLLKQIDRLVVEHHFPNRSRAIQEAVREKLERMERGRLERELSKLDVVFERQLANQGSGELQE